MGNLISEPQDPVNLRGLADHWARTHLGDIIRPSGEHVFCVRLPMPQPMKGIIIPEDHLAPYGNHQAGAPLQYASVLALGPEVHEVEVGDFAVVDPMNSNPVKFGETWYFFPREIAIMLHSKRHIEP